MSHTFGRRRLTVVAGVVTALVVALGALGSVPASGVEPDVFLSGTVTDADGLPVPDVQLHVVVRGPVEGGGALAVTDSAGRFEAEGIRADATASILVYDGRGRSSNGVWSGTRGPGSWVHSKQDAAVYTAGESVSLQLAPRATVSGTATDEDGVPVAGVQVAVYAYSEASQSWVSVLTPLSGGDEIIERTTADGVFRFGHLLPGHDYRLAFAFGDRTADGVYSADDPSGLVPRLEDGSSVAAGSTLDVRLPRGQALAGTVTTATGQAASGIDVTAWAETASGLVAVDRVKVVAGAYSFSRLIAGRSYAVSVGSRSVAGYYNAEGFVAVSAGVSSIVDEGAATRVVAPGSLDFSLVDSPGFTGRLVAAGGGPLGSVRLTVVPPSGRSWSGYTAADGTFKVLNQMPGEPVRVAIDDSYGRIDPAHGWLVRCGSTFGVVVDPDQATSFSAGDAIPDLTADPACGRPAPVVTPTPTPTAVGVVNTAAPTVTGAPKVGATLSASRGTWAGDPTAFAYQWLRNGAAIAGAAGASYKPIAADLGAKLSVRVTASKTGAAPATKTSPATTAVVAGTLTSSTVPVVKGTAKVASTLTATPGVWAPAGVKVTYRWLRGGVAIAGATASTYKPVAADVGRRLAVRVTASLPGYTTAFRTSAATLVVARSTASAKVSFTDSTVTTAERAVVKVRVTTPGVTAPTGTVRVTVGTKSYAVALTASAKGVVKLRLPKLARGTYAVKATFTPSTATGKVTTSAKSPTVKLKVS